MVGFHHERYYLVQLNIMVCVMLCNFQDQVDRPDAIKMVRNHFFDRSKPNLKYRLRRKSWHRGPNLGC